MLLNCKLAPVMILKFVWIKLICFTDCCLQLGWTHGTSALIKSVSSLYSVGKSDMKLLQFSLQQTREATDDFHEENKLGEGGFGPVFKVLNSAFVFY